MDYNIYNMKRTTRIKKLEVTVKKLMKYKIYYYTLKAGRNDSMILFFYRRNHPPPFPIYFMLSLNPVSSNSASEFNSKK